MATQETAKIIFFMAKLLVFLLKNSRHRFSCQTKSSKLFLLQRSEALDKNVTHAGVVNVSTSSTAKIL